MDRGTRLVVRLLTGLVGLAAVLALATPAQADSIVSDATKVGNVLHYGKHENGYVSYAVGVEFYVDATGRYVRARGVATIDKEFRVAGVRVDRVRLGIVTAPGGVLTDARVPATDGGGPQATKRTLWSPVTSDVTACSGFTIAARAWFTVRWADGRYGSFSALSRPTSVPVCRR